MGENFMPVGYSAIVLHAHLPFVRHPEYDFFFDWIWFWAVCFCSLVKNSSY
ncbi:MAG: hypothetical protein AABZ74_08610 [Cyanobacteriota bacterium]